MTRAAGRLASLALLAAAIATVLLGTAGPASAHAFLLSSDPTEGQILPSAPEGVELRFSETVTPVPDAVAVFDAEGEPVATTSGASDDVLTVSLDEPVAEGTLVLVWRVVSADGHPVGGSLRFSVGAASSAVVEPPQADVAEEGGVLRPPWALAPLRVLGYVGLLLAAGLVAFLFLFLPDDRDAARPRRRLVRTARVAAVAAGLAWLAGLPVVAAYQLGGGVGVLSSGSTWSAVPAGEYLVVAGVVLGLGTAVVLLGGGRTTSHHRAGALLAAGAGIAAPALTGHARAASPEVLVLLLDVLHLAAGAVWLGGLAGLSVALVDLADRGDLAASTLARFSTVASGALALLVLSGSVMGWRIVGSWAALTGTTFGLLLLAKVSLAALAVAVAAWNRWFLLPRLRAAARRRDRRAGARPVVRATAVEAALLLVVLAVTGVLVDRTPDLAQADASTEQLDPAYVGPHLASLADLEVQAGVSPHAVGPNELTLQVRDATGVPTRTTEPPRVTLATDEVDLGRVELTRVAPGTYTADVVLPRPGIWKLQVSLRVSEFDNPVSTIEFGVS